MSSAAQMLRDEDVQEVIDRSLAKRVRTMHLAPLLGKVLTVMTEDDRHQEVLDEVIQLASRTVNENSDLIRERIEQETPWWIPSAMDDKIFKRVLGRDPAPARRVERGSRSSVCASVSTVAPRVHRSLEHVARIRGTASMPGRKNSSTTTPRESSRRRCGRTARRRSRTTPRTHTRTRRT